MKMKKTLIALSVAVSAIVSGSAMANEWSQSSTGGDFSLGGTLTPSETEAVWEVKVGPGNNSLDAEIASGQQVVDITLPADLLVLGVRSVQGGFWGKSGISPQLDYGNALDTSSFSGGLADLTLNVTDTSGNNIGTLTTKLAAGAMMSDSANQMKSSVFANAEGYAFYGGIPGAGSSVLDASALAARVDSTVSETFLGSDWSQGAARSPDFSYASSQYSAFYLSAMLTDNPLTITLDTTPDSSVTWRSQLPVTVSYQ